MAAHEAADSRLITLYLKEEIRREWLSSRMLNDWRTLSFQITKDKLIGTNVRTEWWENTY